MSSPTDQRLAAECAILRAEVERLRAERDDLKLRVAYLERVRDGGANDMREFNQLRATALDNARVGVTPFEKK